MTVRYVLTDGKNSVYKEVVSGILDGIIEYYNVTFLILVKLEDTEILI